MKLYYEETGSGEPMVLLHGNGEDSSYFKNQVEYFSKNYRCLLYTSPSPRDTR